MAPVAQRISHCYARLTTRCAGYVPDGLTEEQYTDIKIRDSRSRQRKDLGTVGVIKFKSRSMRSFVADGTPHLFPVDPKAVQRGDIDTTHMPYMQRRAGSWDDADLAGKVPGLHRKKWLPYDKQYHAWAEKAAQSVNLYGTRLNMPWTGTPRAAPKIMNFTSNPKQTLRLRGSRPKRTVSASRQLGHGSATMLPRFLTCMIQHSIHCSALLFHVACHQAAAVSATQTSEPLNNQLVQQSPATTMRLIDSTYTRTRFLVSTVATVTAFIGLRASFSSAPKVADFNLPGAKDHTTLVRLTVPATVHGAAFLALLLS
eukprot:14148-Heterococcus_DN1.PRE.6